MEELDVLLKDILEEDVNTSDRDINNNFLKLKKILVKSNKKRDFWFSFSCIDFKRVVAIAVCSILCAITILISSSSTVRASALNALNGIKTIFVVEGSGNDVKIVQKPADEDYFTISEGYNTAKSDAELGEIIGYKVMYPETLAGFDLECRALHAALWKKLSYDSIPKIRQQLNKAIVNQQEFSKLAGYSPFRFVSGSYKKGNKSIYIYAFPEQFSTPPDCKKAEEIIIGDIKGFWCETIYADYPEKAGEANMSVKPDIEDTSLLYWVNNNVYYTLTSLAGDDFSKEDAVRLASKFQAAQP